MHFKSIRAACMLAAIVASSPLEAQDAAQEMGAPYHDASRAFIDVMIPHHEVAIMMAEHQIGMSKSEAVKAMARKMAADQRREIAQLREARRALFGADSARVPMMRAMMQMMGMEHMHDSAAQHGPHPGRAMPGMPGAMPGMMPGDHDRMFLEHMISHHRDGIDMSVLAEDSQAAARVKQLATTIRVGQEREITEMRRILATLPAMPAGGRKR